MVVSENFFSLFVDRKFWLNLKKDFSLTTIIKLFADPSEVSVFPAGCVCTFSNMWCVGHSLGARVCANVGMNTGQTIARVTGKYIFSTLLRVDLLGVDLWSFQLNIIWNVFDNLPLIYSLVSFELLGLDPAGPWFENYDHSTGINPSVASFVDIIHTMAHRYCKCYIFVKKLD